MPFPCRLAVLAVPLALAACDGVAGTEPGYRQPVTNASNGQPEPAGSLPRGAATYGNPPAIMSLSAGGVTRR